MHRRVGEWPRQNAPPRPRDIVAVHKTVTAEVIGLIDLEMCNVVDFAARVRRLRRRVMDLEIKWLLVVERIPVRDVPAYDEREIMLPEIIPERGRVNTLLDHDV